MTKTKTSFDQRLSLQIDAIHAELEAVRSWPASIAKLRRLVALKRRLRKLESKIPGR